MIPLNQRVLSHRSVEESLGAEGFNEKMSRLEPSATREDPADLGSQLQVWTERSAGLLCLNCFLGVINYWFLRASSCVQRPQIV